MPWQYRDFEVDGVAVPLPVYNPSQDLSPAPIVTRYVRSSDGVVDVRGSEASDFDGQQTHSLTGIYWGETEYWVDEAGDYLIDENGDYLIFGDGPTMLRSQVTALREAYGKVGILWRENVELDDVRQWKRCEFSEMSQPQDVRDRMFMASISCGFTTNMTYWHAEDVTTVEDETLDGVALVLPVENVSSVTIEDALLTITHSSGTIAAVAIACEALGIDIEWAGELVTNHALVFDAATTDIPDNAEDEFSGFTRGEGHTAAGWLPIPPGTWELSVTVTGGNADVSLTYYNQFI